MTNTEMLERKIEEKGIKIDFIAAKLGVSASDLLLKISGEKEFLVSELWIVGKMLELEADEVEEIFFDIAVECDSTKKSAVTIALPMTDLQNKH